MLESAATDWSRVLDLYAGTGALGIEALSRGADWADFVEKNRSLCALIKENLKRTGFTEQGTVYCMSVARAISFLNGKYGILFMDAPYADPSTTAIMEKLSSSRLVGNESTLVVEHSRRMPFQEIYGAFHQIKNLRHGDSCVTVYQRDEVES